MHAAIREGLRLRAIRNNQETFAFRNERRIPLNEQTLIWTALTSPGDQSSLMGLLLGSRSEEPVLYLCNNLQNYDDVGKMYSMIANDISERLKERPWLQIAVGTPSDAKSLASFTESVGAFGNSNFSKSLRKNGLPWNGEDIMLARKLGAFLANVAIIRPANPYQAALVILSSELAEHYATPISDQERGHLGIHLAWIRGITRESCENQANIAIQNIFNHQPVGTLDEIITEAKELFKVSQDTKELHEIITTSLRKIRALQEEAYDLLVRFPEGTCSAWFNEVETNSHTRARELIKKSIKELNESYENKKKLPMTTGYIVGSKKVGSRISRFLRQEKSLENDSLAMLGVDPVARAGGKIEGDVLFGTIESCEQTTERYAKWIIVIKTKQPLIAMDEGDKIDVLDSNNNGKIFRIQQDNHHLLVSVYLSRFPGNIGTLIELTKKGGYTGLSNIIKRRIGSDKTSRPEEGGIDPEQHSIAAAGIKTSRYSGPSWTHDHEVPKPNIRVKTKTSTTRVEDLIKKYQ